MDGSPQPGTITTWVGAHRAQNGSVAELVAPQGPPATPPQQGPPGHGAQHHGKGWEIPKEPTAAVPVQGCAAQGQRMPPGEVPSLRSLIATLHLGDWGALTRAAGRVVEAARRQENS